MALTEVITNIPEWEIDALLERLYVLMIETEQTEVSLQTPALNDSTVMLNLSARFDFVDQARLN